MGQPHHEQAELLDPGLPAAAGPRAPAQEQRDRVRVGLRRGLRTVATEPLMPQEPVGDLHHLKIRVQHRPVPLPGRQPHRERSHPHALALEVDSRERLPATSATPTENHRTTGKITRFVRRHATGSGTPGEGRCVRGRTGAGTPATSGPRRCRWRPGSRTTATPASGSRSPGRCSTCSRISVPSMTGSSPSWSIQQPRWVSRGWHPVPGWWRLRGAVAGGVGAGGVLRRRARWPGRPGRTPGRGGAGGPVVPGSRGRLRQPQHPVRAQPAEQLDGQVGQQERQPGDVVAGVEHDQDGRVARRASARPRPAGRRPHAAARRSPRWRRRRGPAGPRPAPRSSDVRPGSQRGDERVRPARDHLRVALRPAVDVAEQPVCAGLRRPGAATADIDRQHDPPVRRPRQRQRRPAPGAAAAAPPGPWSSPSYIAPCPRRCSASQRQLDQRPHRPVRAQHRVGQLEQRIRPRGQRGVELLPEPRQLPERRPPGMIVQTLHRSPCVDLFLRQKHDRPRAALVITGGSRADTHSGTRG